MSLDQITSTANPLIKDIRKAQDGSALTSNGWLIAEGPHLVAEAVRSGLRIRCVLVSEEFRLAITLPPVRTITVPAHVFRSFSGTETPQGILALAEPPVHTIADLDGANPLLVILDGVQDPGNAGTLARSAEAFGATGMVFLEGSSNPLHPKTLRASAGSLFRIPFIRSARDLAFAVKAFAGVADATAPAPWECDLTRPCALIIGNEGGGVSPALLRKALPIRIPTAGVESLNAAVAGSMLLYEAARQRSRRP